MHKIIVSDLAINDIENTTKYIAEEFDNFEATDRLIKDLYKAFNLIENNPYIGSRVRIHKMKVHKWVVRRKYLVYYEINESNKIILVYILYIERGGKFPPRLVIDF